MSGALPKKRKPKGRRNQRRAHIHVVLATITPCAQCKKMIPTHSACPNCGTYRGRTVVDIAALEAKRLKKEKARKREETETGRS